MECSSGTNYKSCVNHVIVLAIYPIPKSLINTFTWRCIWTLCMVAINFVESSALWNLANIFNFL